ncbi:unnamed protein product [Rotaria socialis]|uniref:Uncharacterized protein n=1 Tax=Rotaria socialis TaxID=392032 RepID=A0A818CZG7_9BILA|nr:unnamed protein product [Rotaria socialis]CAF3435590.1 unnamed protein product [Rotaria socialis]CAF4569065.1 unnamed protein product [Rotaria socialis]CAF4893096.1 unnamed protein product [Rotaria socialis]
MKRLRRERVKSEKLQDCCAKLYTKQCFLFPIVNTTLRDDDRTKLETVDSYCYLVYNYIGRRIKEGHSIRRRLLEIVDPAESQSLTVYRGDTVYHEEIEKYRQAIGHRDVYFKWLLFVSTSLDRDVAKTCGQNVLYIIELRRYLSNVQFTYLNKTHILKAKRKYC